MTIKKAWRVRTEEGTEIREVYVECGFAWYAIYKTNEEPPTRANFLSAEEAMEFAVEDLKDTDYEEIPLDFPVGVSFPEGTSMGCGVPWRCSICGEKPPLFEPIKKEDLLVPMGKEDGAILSLHIPHDDIVTSQSVTEVEEEE